MPDRVYRVIFQIPGGAKRSAELKYIRTSSSDWRFSDEPSEEEAVTHCFQILEGDSNDYPGRIRSPDGLAIPAAAIISSEPVE